MTPETNLPPASSEFKLLSDRYEGLKEALEILYIPKNAAGRINFAKNWPAAGDYIFGSELHGFDLNGVTDRERRAALELQAVERQEKLLQTMAGLEQASTQQGVLQVEYVKTLVLDLGRDLALCVYHSKIVDRFIPPPPESKPEEAPQEDAGASGDQPA